MREKLNEGRAEKIRDCRGQFNKKFTAVIYNKLECFPCQALSNGFLRPGTCPRVERMKGASHGKAIRLERDARDKHLS